MGLGPNYVLSKGHVATGTDAYKRGEFVKADATGLKVSRATTANQVCRGVCMEDVDAAKVTTGKVVVGVDMLGITQVLAGGTVAVDDLITNNASARGVKATSGQIVHGKALTPATSGQYFEMLQTPGAVAPA